MKIISFACHAIFIVRMPGLSTAIELHAGSRCLQDFHMASSEDEFMAICQDDNSTEESLETVNTQPDPSPKSISFDMWNGCRVDNFRAKLGENRAFRPLCVYVLKQVTDYLDNINVKYSVCGGTALSVYREKGRMIKHDGDVDIIIFESDFSQVVQNLSSFSSMQDGYIDVLDTCPVKGSNWFDKDGKEIVYNGCGGKRLKFFGTQLLWKMFKIRPDLRLDPSKAHLDVFTFGYHPDNPECFCYNWNIPGSYDYKRKQFPISCVLPLKTYNFEGLEVQGPNDLKTFLEIEYGYLGRDAMFDFTSQLYVKIPVSVYEKLPQQVKKVMAYDSSESLLTES